jgi:hypothetical protein
MTCSDRGRSIHAAQRLGGCGAILIHQAVAAFREKAHADSRLGVGGGNSGRLVTGINGACQAGKINKSWRKYHGRWFYRVSGHKVRTAEKMLDDVKSGYSQWRNGGATCQSSTS